MKILILGGTGAMGIPLISKLQKNGHEVYVTSRSKRRSNDIINYLQGDAHDTNFLKKIMKFKYDAIVDFMTYTPKEFEERVELLLNNTNQYVFLSSSRVYANSNSALTEASPRLLDNCTDLEYVTSDEYAIAKAKEENVLFGRNETNWTIVRPYITYNDNRLQLGVFEKENWLYRVINKKAIVIPNEIAEHTTTFTYGPDVAEGILRLIGNSEALGQAYHITTSQNAKWSEILNIYCNIIKKEIGYTPKVIFTDEYAYLERIWNRPQIIYDRLYDRKFDNSKMEKTCGKIAYRSLEIGLEYCLVEFLKKPNWKNINWGFEAWADQKSGENSSLTNIPDVKNKLRYLKHSFLCR